jgi:uncharacterized protein YwgA
MKRLQKAAVLVALADEMRDRGSWSGETHLQKAAYFLQQVFDPDLDFDFILYKHGPFSFDLRDELLSMRSDGLLRLEPQPYPYGPRLAATAAGEEMKTTYARTLRERGDAIRLIADHLAQKDVNQLERVATALWVTRQDPEASVSSRALGLHQLKPHVSVERATEAVQEVDRFLAEANRLIAA